MSLIQTILSKPYRLLTVCCLLAIVPFILVYGQSTKQHVFPPTNYGQMIGSAKKGTGHALTNGRYESAEVWRLSDLSDESFRPDNRPKAKSTTFGDISTYLQNPVISDYAPGSEKLFLMIKTGASVLWQRLPVHLFTTLTRVPHFALYSDAPGSISGYEVIDIMANLTEESKNRPELVQYKRQLILHDDARVLDYGYLDMHDGWNLDKFKNIPMLQHAYQNSPKSDWFFFMDADTHVIVDNLMALTKGLDPNKPYYMGYAVGDGHYQFCHGGSGVLISRGALEKTVGEQDFAHIMEQRTFDECCGDLMVGYMMIDNLGIAAQHMHGFNGVPYWELDFYRDRWCDLLVTLHHVKPREVEIIWEYEKMKRLQGQKITNAQLYEDFFLPYMVDRKAKWDNKASQSSMAHWSYGEDKEKGITPKSEGGDQERPYESFEACRRECEKEESCLSFTLKPAAKRCDMADFFRFGRPVADWLKTSDDYTETNVESGWMINRIQSFRKTAQCDGLSREQNRERLLEGWFNKES